MNAKGLRTSIAVFQLVPASLAPVTFPRFPWCFLEWLYDTSSCSGRYACLVFTGTTVLFNLFTRGGSVKPTEDSLSITSDFDVSMVLLSYIHTRVSTTPRIDSAGLRVALRAAAQMVSSSKVFHLLNLSFSLETKTLWPPSLALRWKPKLCRVKCPFLLHAHTWRSLFPQGSILARPYSRVLWADRHWLVCRLVMVPLAGSQLHCCCWECGMHSARPMPSASWWDTRMHFSSRVFLMRKPFPSASSQGRRQMQLRLSLKSSIVSQLGRGRSLGSPFCHSRQKKTARRRNLLFCPSAGALAAGLSAKRRRWDAVPLGVIQ